MDCHVDGHRKRIGRNRGLTEAVLRKRKVQIAEGGSSRTSLGKVSRQ
jgi:hypothetical protein